MNITLYIRNRETVELHAAARIHSHVQQKKEYSNKKYVDSEE